MLVELMHSSITAKERKNAKLIPSKMTVKLSFVTPGMEKMGKMVEDFIFLPNIITDFVYCYTLLHFPTRWFDVIWQLLGE